MSDKAKDVHFKILHNIYQASSIIAKFKDVDDSSPFCNHNRETILHLFFFYCNISKKLSWSDAESYFLMLLALVYSLTFKDVICYYVNLEDNPLVILYAK